MESVSVVVPVYNSAATLQELVTRLTAVLKSEAVAFEIILINDGSRDTSWETIEQLAGVHRHVRGINLSRNYGQQNALLCGVRAARHGIVVTLDDDLQHPPEEVPKLLRKLEAGADVVYGAAQTVPHGHFRGAGSRLTKWLLEFALGAQTGCGISAFRAFRTCLRDAFRDYRGPQVMLDFLLTWGTTRVATIHVPHQPRRVGTSNYSFFRLAAHAIHLLTSFSTLPLRLASWVGVASLMFGLLVLAWVLGNYLYRGTSQPGFPFLASIIAIFAGAQMFALGILGEYLAQVHGRLMEKPAYLIRTDTSAGGGARMVA